MMIDKKKVTEMSLNFLKEINQFERVRREREERG